RLFCSLTPSPQPLSTKGERGWGEGVAPIELRHSHVGVSALCTAMDGRHELDTPAGGGFFPERSPPPHRHPGPTFGFPLPAACPVRAGSSGPGPSLWQSARLSPDSALSGLSPPCSAAQAGTAVGGIRCPCFSRPGGYDLARAAHRPGCPPGFLRNGDP